MAKVTIDEIAERVRVSRRTVHRWANKPEFPTPVGRRIVRHEKGPRSSSAQVWAWNSVREWLVLTGRWDDLVGMPTGRFHHTVCRKGLHDVTDDDDVYITAGHGRICRACVLATQRAARKARSEPESEGE